MLTALVDDVFGMWERRGRIPDVTVFSEGRTWGDGPVAVAGSLGPVAAWITGRSAGADLDVDGRLPDLPGWL